ncbi:Allatotropin [Formica fusca]
MSAASYKTTWNYFPSPVLSSRAYADQVDIFFLVKGSPKSLEIMRVILAIALLFVAGFFIVTASKGRDYPRFFKHRTKLREIRGFKPEYISTAIGFGKREDPVERTSDFRGRERILLSLLRNFPRSVSAEVLFRMMQTNPALADKLMIQNNRDNRDNRDDRRNEESIMDHSKPDRIFALI